MIAQGVLSKWDCIFGFNFYFRWMTKPNNKIDFTIRFDENYVTIFTC